MYCMYYCWEMWGRRSVVRFNVVLSAAGRAAGVLWAKTKIKQHTTMTINNNAVVGKTHNNNNNNNNNSQWDNDIIAAPIQQRQQGGTDYQHSYYDQIGHGGNVAVSVSIATDADDVMQTTTTNNNQNGLQQQPQPQQNDQQPQPKQPHKFCFVCYCCGKTMRQTVILVDTLGICISIVGIILFTTVPPPSKETPRTIGESFLPEFVFEESSEQWKFRVYFTSLLNITFHSLSLRGTYKFYDWMIRLSTAWFLLLLVIPVLLTLSRWQDIIKTNSKFLWLLLASIVWNGIFVIYPHCVAIREMRLGYYYIADDTRSRSTALNPINTW